MYNLFKDFFLQASYIPCQKHYICIHAVAIKHAGSSVIVQAPKREHEFMTVFVNNQILTKLYVTLTKHHTFPITVKRISRLRVMVSIGTEGSVEVFLYSRYLAISCSFSAYDYCYNSSGLLGSCDNFVPETFNRTFRRRSSSVFENNATTDLSNVNQEFMQNFSKSWLVRPNENLLNVTGLDLSKVYHALRINNTILNTKELFSFAGEEFTIETIVRVLEPGVVWTYSMQRLFGIALNNTVIIFQNQRIIDTGLTIKLNTWYKITMIFQASTKFLQVYVVEMNGVFSFRTFSNVFAKETFYPGGVLTLGAKPIHVSGKLSVKGFIGDVFQLRIWDKALSTDEIRTQVSSFVPCTTSGLAIMWRFEQIEEPFIVDCVSSIKITIVAGSMSWPAVTLNNVYNMKDFAEIFNQTERLNALEVECRKIFGMKYTCRNLNNDTSNLFTTMCIRELWETDVADYPRHTAAVYNVFCSKSEGESRQRFCYYLSVGDREWSGANCSKPCLFGQFDLNDHCICTDNFYGASCANECPGGFFNSCYGQGKCNKQTGECGCQINFERSNCYNCAGNWTFSDCAMVRRADSPHFKRYTCQSFKQNFVGFSATAFSLNSFGEFYLIKSDSIELQGRFIPCAASPICLHAVGLRVDKDNITIYNPNITGNDRFIWHNSLPTTVNSVKKININLHIIPISISKFKLAVLGPEPMNVTITFLPTDIILTITSFTCKMTNGLCGSCDTYSAFDFNSNRSHESLTRMMENERVNPSSRSLFIYRRSPLLEERAVSEFQHTIFLNGSGLSSGEVRNLFHHSADFTIEIFVKLSSMRGTLLSYSNEETIGIVVAETFKIYKGTEVIDCKIKPKLQTWVRLVMTFDANNYVLSFFQFTSQHRYEMHKTVLKQPLFGSKGHLLFGYWQAKRARPDADQLALFVGSIDELRIWNKRLHQFQLMYLHKPRIEYSKSLRAYWEFNEAHGREIVDHISRIILYIPNLINPLYLWQFSDQKRQVEYLKSKAEVSNQTLRSAVHSLCSSMIYHQDLEARCGKFVGKAFVDFYFIGCLENGYHKGSIDGIYSSVMAYVSYCQSAIDLRHWPSSKLCDLLPKKYYSSIDALNCAIKCVFGKINHESASCICDKGYWGTDCSKVCPGGNKNVCSGKGDCNVTTGMCDCQETWRGNANCSTCTPGWTGTECQTVIAPEPSTSVCLAMAGGHFVTLNTIHMTFYGQGEFYLLGGASDDVRIHLHQVPCLYDRTRCIKGVGLKTSKDFIKVIAREDENTSPEIFLNEGKIKMASKRYEVGPLVVLRRENSLYDLLLDSNKRDSLRLTIRHIGIELIVSLKVTGKYCNMSNSLCSTCFETGRALFALSHQEIENIVRVPADKFVLVNSMHEMAKFQLMFRGIGLSTNVLPTLYFNKDLTIEIKFTANKISSKQSTLFSLSGRNSFGLIIQQTLKLAVFRTIYDTGYEVEKHVSNQVTMVYSKSDKTITVYYINRKKVIWQYVLQVSPWFSFFDPMSTLVVSEWVSGYRDRLFHPAPGFQGVIEEMRIWRHAYSFVDIQRLLERKVSATDPNILSLWNFDEGNGDIVRDKVSGVDLFIPPVPRGPYWARLTINKNAISIGNDVPFSNWNLKRKAIDWCHVKIFASPLFLKCNALGRPSLR